MILSRSDFSKTNKNFYRSSIFPSSSKKQEPEKRKSLLFSKIKQYNYEKFNQRAVSCYPNKIRNFVYNIKYLNKKGVPPHLNVINLILKKSASTIDINLIENKINRIKKISELNKLNSSTRKKLYEYNIIYGHNTNNIIKSYTTKLIQLDSNVKKNTNKESNIQVFSERQIKELFCQKCKDLNVPIKEELMKRFTNFIKEKCVNRIINLSECCLGVNAMIVLTEILRNNIEICSRIILTKNDFGDEGIELLLESLKGNNNIVELNLSSNSLGVSGGNAIFNFLLDQESILSLDLSSKEGLYRNRLCSEGIKLITKVLQNNFFLEKIDLSSNSIKNEGLKYIVNGLTSNLNLQSLIIPNNEINEKGVLYLESKLQTCKLRHLNISCNPIGNNGIISLGNCIGGIKLSEISSLNFSECAVTFDAFCTFIKKISKNQKIQTLIANRNNLSSENKWHILDDSFKKLSLKQISLGSCNLNSDMKEISNIFKYNPTIKYLDLSHNKITDENFEGFQTYPKENLIIEELDMSSNYISDKSASIFFQNLEDNNNILRLNFFDNHLENQSAEAIKDILRTNHHILNININCNSIGLNVMDEIKQKIKNNIIMEKEKYIPKLRNELKELEFDPDEVGLLKNKINYSNKEREFMMKKFMKEAKDLELKKKDNIKTAKNVDNLYKKIGKNIDNLKNEVINIREEEGKEKESFSTEFAVLKEKISLLEEELKEVNYIKYNLKHKYNEEIGLLKRTYEQTLQNDQIKKLSILSLNNKIKEKNEEYERKVNYLEKLKKSSSSVKRKSSKALLFGSSRFSNKNIKHLND